MTTDARTCNIEGCPTPGHTPGKWHAEKKRDAVGRTVRTPAVRRPLMVAKGESPKDEDAYVACYIRSDDDAELFARAPDLAHALVGLVNVVQHIDHRAPSNDLSERLRVALIAAREALEGASDA